MEVWRDCQVLSEQISDSSAFLNATGSAVYSFFCILSRLSDTCINYNWISQGLLWIQKVKYFNKLVEKIYTLSNF
jgi:hypothetical protein